MGKLYLLTGATGHLGTVILDELLRRGDHVRALVLPGEKEWLLSAHRAALEAAGAAFQASGEEASEDRSRLQIVEGDLTEPESLKPLFQRSAGTELCLIHCAAFISILSRPDPRLKAVNAKGTESLLKLALSFGVEKVVYVNSVHSLPEKAAPAVISETRDFSPVFVHGHYAKSKAEGARIALAYAKKGLNLTMVHPSGIIGPGDRMHKNHSMETLRSMARGKFPVLVRGGYDFVDSRDVAAGVLAAAERGKAGENYILSGYDVTLVTLQRQLSGLSGRRPPVLVLPTWLVKLVAPIGEFFSVKIMKTVPMLTPYAIYTLHTNANFSSEKAAKDLGYQARPLEETLSDLWAAGEL